MKIKKLIVLLVSASMLASSAAAFAADSDPASEAPAEETVEITEIEPEAAEEELELGIAAEGNEAKIGETEYATLQDAINDVGENNENLKTITLLTNISGSNGTVTFPDNFKNVKFVAEEGAKLVNTVIKLEHPWASNAVDLENITFEGVEFDSSYVLIQSYVTTSKFDNWSFNDCNFHDIAGNFAVSFNITLQRAADKGMKGFTFTNNRVNNITNANGLQLFFLDGNVDISGNTISDVAYNALQIQFACPTAEIEIKNNMISSGRECINFGRQVIQNPPGWTSGDYDNRSDIRGLKEISGNIFESDAGAFKFANELITTNEKTTFDVSDNYLCSANPTLENKLTVNSGVYTDKEKTHGEIVMTDVGETETTYYTSMEAAIESGIYKANIGDNYYRTLAEAVTAAQDGDTISLLADDDISLTGGGEIEINKSLTITGAVDDKGEPLYTIYGKNDSTGTNYISITGSGTVKLENLKIKQFGNNAGTNASHAPVNVSANFTGNVDLTNVYVSEFNRGGIFLYGGTFNVDGCYIDCANSRNGAFTKGIEIKGSATGTIKDTTIVNMERAGSDSVAGIEIYGSGSIEVNGVSIISDYGDHESVKATYGIVSSRVGVHDPSGGSLEIRDTLIDTTNGSISVADSDDYGPVNNYSITVDDCVFDNYISTWSAKSSITINSGEYCEDVYADAGTIYIKGGEFGNFAPDTVTGSIVITGGTFDKNPAAYVADGYYAAENDDDTYKYIVLPAETEVIDTAKAGSTTVELTDLEMNLKSATTLGDQAYKATEDATYKVVVTEPSQADQTTALEQKTEPEQKVEMQDIKVIKTLNGESNEVTMDNVNQEVVMTVGDTIDITKPVTVYHIKNGGLIGTAITPTGKTAHTITFTAPSFSTYAAVYTPASLSPADVTGSIGVVFSPVSAGSNEYYINLKSLDGKTIDRFMSTDLAFVNNCATVDYEIEPVPFMNVTQVCEKDNTREYHFEMNGNGGNSSLNGTGITIGTIRFNGYGTLDFTVDNTYTVTGRSVNIVNTAKDGQNIVRSYTVGGDLIVGTAVDADTYSAYRAADEKGVISDTLSKTTKKLTINVTFPNAVETGNAVAFQDMKLTISGGDLANNKVVKLGGTAETEGFASGETVTVTPAQATNTTDASYTIEIDKTLTQYVSYNLMLEGAGYRTARYNAFMDNDKTLNFWNNVYTTASSIDGVADPVTKNFLAGDIVRDNKINIYDLSAVVSYFGSVNDKTGAWNYVNYDLNRDGAIDSKDIAYVLISWGE